jgi:phosphate starvation-inducible protein PhoH
MRRYTKAFGSIALSDVSGVCSEMAGGLNKQNSAKYARDFCSGSVDPISRPLNPSQLSALEAALTKRVSLIQGPPGTGKTHTSVAVVKGLLAGAYTRPLLSST